MEDRDRDLLSLDVLAELLESGEPIVREAVAEMSRRKGADAVRGWLMKCAGYLDTWYQPDWQGDLTAPVRRLLPEMGGIDLAPLVVLIAVAALRIILMNNIGAFY